MQATESSVAQTQKNTESLTTIKQLENGKQSENLVSMADGSNGTVLNSGSARITNGSETGDRSTTALHQQQSAEAPKALPVIGANVAGNSTDASSTSSKGTTTNAASQTGQQTAGNQYYAGQDSNSAVGQELKQEPGKISGGEQSGTADANNHNAAITPSDGVETFGATVAMQTIDTLGVANLYDGSVDIKYNVHTPDVNGSGNVYAGTDVHAAQGVHGGGDVYESAEHDQDSGVKNRSDEDTVDVNGSGDPYTSFDTPEETTETLLTTLYTLVF